jgi:hypothetical protein
VKYFLQHDDLRSTASTDTSSFPYAGLQGCIPFGIGVLHLIQIYHQPDATIFQFIILTFVYSSTCFGRFPAHHQEINECSGSLWLYLRIVVIVVLRSRAGPARPRTQHDCHHNTKVKPEAATADNELLMIGGRPDYERSTTITTIRR